MRTILEKPYVVMAVDPGLSGAVARVGRGVIEVRRDFKQLYDIAGSVYALDGDKLVTHCIIEQVGARPGQGVCSMFSFGKATGVAFGAMYATRLYDKIEEVHPLKWQNWVRRELKMDKKALFDSREICLKLFPDYASLFKRKKDHNTADAMLMGLWKLAQISDPR